MQSTSSISLFVLLMLPVGSFAQDASQSLPNTPSVQVETQRPAGGSDPLSKAAADLGSSTTLDSRVPSSGPPKAQAFGVREKLGYYLTETYLNASTFTAPTFRAAIRMANPPGKGITQYPAEWRQGAEAFGRNYGDAFAERVSFNTARFITGAITREDPRYIPSGSHNVFARSLHAFGFALVDRSDSGRPMPAISNLVGATAGGFVGNAYLPTGFNDVTHAGQRATFRFGMFAAGNLFREFAPQMPAPIRTFVQLIAR